MQYGFNQPFTRKVLERYMTLNFKSIQQFGLMSLAVVTLYSTVPGALAEPAAANEKPSQREHAQQKGERYKKYAEAHQKFMQELNLSDEQKAKMKAAHEKFRQENAAAMDSLKAKYKQMKQLGSEPANDAERQKLKAEIRQEREALMIKKKASMQGILTPEQQAKWDAKQAERRAQWQQKKK
jgi:Spy/CpxP family protein refolding chaperone